MYLVLFIFLLVAAVDCSLEDVLQFVSGSRCLPAGGLNGINSVPTIEFISKGFPTAATCGVTLRLPLQLPAGVTSLKDALLMAVMSSPLIDVN